MKMKIISLSLFGKLIGVFIGLLLLVMLAIGNYFYDVAINVDKRQNSPVLTDSQDKKDVAEAKKWFDQQVKRMYVVSPVNQARLVGYKLVHDPKAPWIVFVHGYHRNARFYAHYIRSLYQLGYNVLAYDLNGHGSSEGKVVFFGGYDADDLVAWVKELTIHHPESRIGLFGISMGATTVMNSLQKLKDNSHVAAFVAYGGYVNLKEQLSFKLQSIYGLPSFPILDFTDAIARVRANYSLKDVDITASLSQNNKPALIMHDEQDTMVPFSNLQKIYDLLPGKDKTKHSFPTDHTEAEERYRSEFWKLVGDFYQHHLPKTLKK